GERGQHTLPQDVDFSHGPPAPASWSPRAGVLTPHRLGKDKVRISSATAGALPAPYRARSPRARSKAGPNHTNPLRHGDVADVLGVGRAEVVIRAGGSRDEIPSGLRGGAVRAILQSPAAPAVGARPAPAPGGTIGS